LPGLNGGGAAAAVPPTFPERFTSRPRQTTKPFRKDLKKRSH